MPEFLSKLQWVDLFRTDGFDKLLSAINAGAKGLGMTLPKSRDLQSLSSFEKNSIDSIKIMTRQALKKGKNYLEKKQYEEAIENFKRVLEYEKENFEAQFNLACALKAFYEGIIGEEEEVVREFEKAYYLNSSVAKDEYLLVLKTYAFKLSKIDYFEKEGY